MRQGSCEGLPCEQLAHESVLGLGSQSAGLSLSSAALGLGLDHHQRAPDLEGQPLGIDQVAHHLAELGDQIALRFDEPSAGISGPVVTIGGAVLILAWAVVPMLAYGKGVRAGVDLGTRRSFACIAQTVCEYLGVPVQLDGKSFLKEILR